MFVDRVRVWLRAGDGGHGCISFHREKFVPKGGPDGGNGGKGGDIVIKVNANLNNLIHLKYKPHIFAPHGKNGGAKQCTGGSGRTKVVEVPPGTCIYLLPTVDENFERAADDEKGRLVADMVETGQEFIICKGGMGGRGNMTFKSSTNQAPRRADPGQEGEKGQFIFELKSIADVGLVGFPNAGKSSLLATVSAAHPKIAPYPFTTLEPMVGVIEEGYTQRITVADIPGLIEGAHEGVGLGHDFLRHIERCKVLLFVLDMAGSEGRDPYEDYKLLRKELDQYNPELSKRPFVIAANKMDIPEATEHLKAFKRKRVKSPIIPISTKTREGVDELTKVLFECAS